MVILGSVEADEAVVVEGVVLLSKNAILPSTPLARPPPQAPQRISVKRQAPPPTGRDNSASRYREIKYSKLGSRRQRRWDNWLSLKAGLQALSPDRVDDGSTEPIAKACVSVFSTLVTSDEERQLWDKFELLSLQEQQAIVDLSKSDHSDPRLSNGPMSCYLRIERSIRLALRRCNLPMGLVADMEKRTLAAFTEDPQALMVTSCPDSFSRLIQHGICQYLGLKSQSANTDDGLRITTICNPNPVFAKPAVLLSTILTSGGREKSTPAGTELAQ